MMCFRCFRVLKSKDEIQKYAHVVIEKDGGKDGYWLCPECAGKMMGWMWGRIEPG